MNESTTVKPQESACGDGGTWLRGPLLGKGGFGDVHVAYFHEPALSKRFEGFPSAVAVKSTDSWGKLKVEKKVYDALGPSPFLLRCFGDDVTVADDDYTLLFNVFLEYASGGTLEHLIENSEGARLLEPQARAFTRSILCGINHIHNAGLVHRDLHPGNILLVEDGEGFVAKIGDLGLAKPADDEDEALEGTLMYFAPETLRGGAQGRAADIWALGCVVFAMLTGTLVWDGVPRITAMAEHGVSIKAEDFVRKCLEADPSDRPSTAGLLSHPFVSECDNEVLQERDHRRGEKTGSATTESKVGSSDSKKHLLLVTLPRKRSF